MTEPTKYHDISSTNTVSPSYQKSIPESGILTVNLKHIPLIIGLLLGAGGGGSLGSYMSNGHDGFDKVVKRLESIEHTLIVMQRKGDRSDLIVDRLTKDLDIHLNDENDIQKDFEKRLRILEKKL